MSKEQYVEFHKYLAREYEKLENIIKEVREFVEWHYKDNQEFYKNKGIGLNYPECDYILEILDKVDKEDKQWNYGQEKGQ